MDTTGLKIYGKSKWKTRKHGKENQYICRQYHLAVDVSSHAVIAAEVNLVFVGENEILSILINQLRRKI
ncbi:hypothetical protein [Candidatus Enterovibrio escicola]|uniref:hypothetical protein n=1 Tax=Candidatus Enterovibrio escicola TaxID=1927127 RepID=UPI0030DB9ECC